MFPYVANFGNRVQMSGRHQLDMDSSWYLNFIQLYPITSIAFAHSRTLSRSKIHTHLIFVSILHIRLVRQRECDVLGSLGTVLRMQKYINHQKLQIVTVIVSEMLQNIIWQFSFRVGRAMMQFSIPYLFHSIPVSSNLHLSISSPSSRLNNKAAVPTWFCASSGISGSAFNPPSCGNLREFAGWYQKLSNILNLSQSQIFWQPLTTIPT